MNQPTFISSGRRSVRTVRRLSRLLAAAVVLAAAVQTSVAQNLGSMAQATAAGAPYNTVYFGIYPQTLFHTVLEAMDHSPAPLYPGGPFVVVASDNQELNGGALSFGKSPRPQATIMDVVPLKWRIVKDDSEGFLLLTDGNVDVQAYSNASWDGTWADASLRTWLRDNFLGGESDGSIPRVYKGSLASYLGGDFNDLIGTIFSETELDQPTYAVAGWTAISPAQQTDFFTPAEKGAIVEASLENPTLGADPDNVTTQDWVFLPAASVVEAVYPTPGDRSSVNSRYVMSYENTTSAPADDDWLTRSHSDAPFPGYVTQVVRSSGVLAPEAAISKKAIRPALYLDRDKVLMVSTDKTVPIVSPVFPSSPLPSFTPSSNTLKLTLVDNALASFAASGPVPDGYTTISTPYTLGITYSGGSVEPDSYISCLLEDNTGIKYYIKAEDYSTASSSTTLDFSNVPPGAYTLKVFNEIVNLTDKPDRASKPASFEVFISGVTFTPPVINTGETLSAGFIGKAYSDTVKISSGDVHTFTISDGLLPDGLSLNAATGRITGIPIGPAGTSTFKVKAQNPTSSSDETFTITISQIVAPVIITPQGALTSGYLSIPYSFQIELQPGTGLPSDKLKFSVSTGGALPIGLAINETTGMIQGTPTTVETQNFTICAETEGTYAYGSYTISILVSEPVPGAPVFGAITLPTAKENDLYAEVTIPITGSQYINVQYDPATFPTGMSFDPYAWKILGTPIQGTAGSYNLHLWAKNPATKPANPSGPDSVGILYPLTVEAANVPIITTPSTLPAAGVGQPYSETFTTDKPATLQLQGGLLPSPVAFVSPTLSGTPLNAGTYTFTIKATNADGSTSKTFTLPVQPHLPAPIIDVFTLPNGMVGEAYVGVTVPALNSPTLWTWTGAPPGLSLSNSGTVSGIPTVAGVYDVTFTATNAWGDFDTKTETVVISQSPLNVPPVLVNAVSDGIEGTPYYVEVFLFNRPDIVWTLEKGVLPAGLTFEDGVISGTPVSGEGKYTVTVQAASEDSRFAPVTKVLTIWIMSFREENRSRRVVLPVIPGMTTDRAPNTYYVKSGDDFEFVITPDGGPGIVPEVTTGRVFTPDSTGVTVTPNSDGVSYTVVIKNVHEEVNINAVPSANAPVESAARVWSAAGRLYIFSTAATEARIYDVAGRLVRAVPVEANRTAVSTPGAGLYIVELDNKTVYKVLVQ